MSNRLVGYLQKRVVLTQQRLLQSGCPTFTTAFILADLLAEKPSVRRFSEFSGDLSGRYLGALSLWPDAGSEAELKKLARTMIKQQRPDGRFGDPDLDFSGPEVNKTHMPLLWGNGRLLVGLMEYYSRFQDAAVLQAAARLGDFLIRVSEFCQNEETAEALKSLGAYGFICFTQCNEGLVLLGEATGEQRYLETAQKIAGWVLPRGKQHSHGYLTTLRGIMHLHRVTGDAKLLKSVEKQFADLVESKDYLVTGGVPEYFGWKEQPLNSDASVAAHSTEESRDEGCSEADFLRLCLQLWQATGKVSYLEKAEHCLLNHLLFNQYSNGDFGHRALTWDGFKSYMNPGRAWWCCTMHGLRAFTDVQEAAVTTADHECRVNLLLDCDHADPETGLKVKFRNRYDRATRRHLVVATITQAPTAPVKIALRQPSWAETEAVTVNGRKATSTVEGGYCSVKRLWKKGDTLELRQSHLFRFVSEDNRPVALKTLQTASAPAPVALFHGPWLLAIHDGEDPLFFSEPSEGNTVVPPVSTDELEHAWGQSGAAAVDGHLRLSYVHQGFPGAQNISLRPLGHQAGSDQKSVKIFLQLASSKKS